MRLVVLPLLLLAAAKFLPAPLALKQVLVVQAAMPSAMTPIMLAKSMVADRPWRCRW